MQSTALIAETSCQQLSPPKQAVDRFNSLCKVLASLTTKPTLTSNLLHHRHRHGFCHESHELILCKIFSGLHKFVNNWLYDNLTPRTIWRFGQFDTIRANRTIWHQEGKEDNLTPRTIWHLGQFDTIITKKIDSQISFLLESFEVKNDQDDILGPKLS